MATHTALLTIEQYLHTSYSPDVDFVDGVIEERHLGEYEHGRLTGLLFAHFHPSAKALGVLPIVEQRIRIDANRVRICDFVLIQAELPRERVTQTPPLLCVEVLSPEDRLARAEVVLTDYRNMGVKHIWLMDPSARGRLHFRRDGSAQHRTAC